MARLHHRGGGGDVYPDHRTIDQGGPNASGWYYAPHDFGVDFAGSLLRDFDALVRLQRRGYLNPIVVNPPVEDV